MTTTIPSYLKVKASNGAPALIQRWSSVLEEFIDQVTVSPTEGCWRAETPAAGIIHLPGGSVADMGSPWSEVIRVVRDPQRVWHLLPGIQTMTDGLNSSECDHCHGEGRDTGVETCDVCDGEGSLTSVGIGQAFPCPACHGLGEVRLREAADVCGRCGGRGERPSPTDAAAPMVLGAIVEWPFLIATSALPEVRWSVDHRARDMSTLWFNAGTVAGYLTGRHQLGLTPRRWPTVCAVIQQYSFPGFTCAQTFQDDVAVVV